ncbi:MAG: hypothetical protein OHK93_008810 [Ramalina farinacea]|uniref:Uncharacterized protein n=1 Tax=Ramalina farinacea TaxID=258253 RepID=A0AA43QQ71_9LECA|nr:hypothetical protein [Ramalina farinacea]
MPLREHQFEVVPNFPRSLAAYIARKVEQFLESMKPVRDLEFDFHKSEAIADATNIDSSSDEIREDMPAILDTLNKPVDAEALKWYIRQQLELGNAEVDILAGVDPSGPDLNPCALRRHVRMRVEPHILGHTRETASGPFTARPAVPDHTTLTVAKRILSEDTKQKPTTHRDVEEQTKA